MTFDTITPTRAAGIARLEAFLPRAGRDYARDRNTDRGPEDRANVSMLAPYVRHRLVTEEEIVAAVLARHSYGAAEKFIQEVCWRTYWKGWLEHRPAVWSDWLGAVETDRTGLTPQARDLLARAEAGTTGIDGFDAWAQELVATGYLHNHARMWFASIWIFTLGLPWTLGAAFFYRHLLDGDPASNTLSWRWVAGLQTRGKTYLARTDNIRTYTLGRFAPDGLAAAAPALDGPPPPPVNPVSAGDALPRSGPVVLVLTDDDLSPETWDLAPERVACAVVLAADDRPVAPHVAAFRGTARLDAAARLAAWASIEAPVLAPDDAAALLASGPDLPVVALAPPVGPAREALAAFTRALPGRHHVRPRRAWDAAFWPHATRGFFALKEHIPDVLRTLSIGPDWRTSA